MYVMQAEHSMCKLRDGSDKKFNVNKKNGICVAWRKHGGLGDSWYLARQLAGWIPNDGLSTQYIIGYQNLR